MSVDKTKVPEFDEFRLYDRAVRDYFSDLRVDSQDVPLIIGTVQRAFASASKLYNSDKKRIPLPVGNMLRANTARDSARFMGIGKMVSEIPAKGKALQTSRPFPVNLTYTLQFRVQTESQANIIQKQLILHASHDRFIIPVQIPGFKRKFNFFGKSTEVVRSDEIDVGEEKDKIHVLSFAVVYEVFLFYPFSLHTYRNEINTTWTVEESEHVI